MAEAFAAKGYETGAFVGAFVLDGRWGLNQGFKHYDDAFDLKKYKKLDLGLVQRPGNQVVDDNHVVATIQQVIGQVRAQEPRAPGHNRHSR